MWFAPLIGPAGALQVSQKCTLLLAAAQYIILAVLQSYILPDVIEEPGLVVLRTTRQCVSLVLRPDRAYESTCLHRLGLE